MKKLLRIKVEWRNVTPERRQFLGQMVNRATTMEAKSGDECMSRLIGICQELLEPGESADITPIEVLPKD